MGASRIHHIDVWRCIAIAMVLLEHILAWSHPWYQQLAPGPVWRLQPLGKVGVQLFFCISGFVICRGLVIEMQERGKVDLGAFYIRRSYRILPPLLMYLAAVALMDMAGIFDLNLRQFGQAAAFLCNVEQLGLCGWALGHTWSLAYEEQFYLVFPALFIALSLPSKRARLPAMMLATCVVLVLGYALHDQFMRTYASHVACILAGCFCALYWKDLAPAFKRIPLWLWMLSVLLIPGLRLVGLPPFLKELVYPLVFPVIACIAIFGTPVQQPLVRQVFEHPLLVHLGKISYGIYLWQQLATADYGFRSPLPALLLLVAAIVGAHYAYAHIELPLIRHGAALARQRSQQAAPLPASLKL